MIKDRGELDVLPEARGLRFAIVVSRFNPAVTGALREGAVRVLDQAGAAHEAVEVFDVPGAFEIPFAARVLASTKRFDAIVCLGCLIRGATPHFEYIASAVSHGITTASLDSGVPMAFGVLTTNTAEEALARAQPDDTNKGREAALAAIEMARLVRQVSSSSRGSSA